jgi:hypothetical protein
MDMNAKWDRRWLAALVLVHLVISIVHGAAHQGAHVPLTTAANLFVFAVILAGPLVGLGLMWPARQIGTWIVAVTMAGSLIFGVLNHFVLAGPDHVAHVDAAWRLQFSATAALLALTEALGSGLALAMIRERETS